MFESRMARLRERMVATGTDLVVVGPSSHMVWLAGLSPHGDERPVLLIVGQQHAGVLMPALNADSARQHTDLPFYPWGDAEGPAAALDRLLADTSAGKAELKIALDETMRADFALRVIDALPGARRTFLEETVGYLRARKEDGEYAALKASALVDDGAMRAAFAALKVGVSELEIAAVVRDYYKAHDTTHEFTLICFGENGAFPHHHTGERRLKVGDAVLMDIGGRHQGYPSDMTRVGTFGPAPEHFHEVHGVLERAVQAAVAKAKPGVLAKDVDRAAREIIEAAGYGEYFLHRTGHGIGVDLHEPPYITASSEVVLEEGHAFSIEPGIYLNGKFGIRLEEIVVIRGGQAQVLSELPRAAFVID